MVNSEKAACGEARGRTIGTFLSRGFRNIGPRLTLCFLIIVLLMGAADAIAVWQFGRIEVPARRFYEADRALLAVMRVHLDVMQFREHLTTLAGAHDKQRFAVQAASERDNFMQDVARAEQTLNSTHYLEQGVPVILEALKTSLPLQADTLVELANAEDWQAVALRLANQVPAIAGLTASLVSNVDQHVAQERTQALHSTQQRRNQLFFVLYATAILSLLTALLLGGFATRSIKRPLSLLDSGARALARGDFQHEVKVEGEDELARVGRAFNYAAGKIRELYGELKHSEARFRSLIDNSSDLILILDREGKIRFVSPACVRVAGRTQQDLQGQNLVSFLSSRDVPKMQEAISSACARSGPAIEIDLQRPDGKRATIEVVTTNLLDEPAVGGIVVNARDITERKHAEEALREAQSDLAHVTRVMTIGELTASLAHELRQPIAAAMTNARTCSRWLGREQPDVEEAREAASRIVKDTTRASEIISRIGSIFKKGEPKRELVDLNDLIREMLFLLQSEANRDSRSIRTRLVHDLPQIIADRVLLQQVLMNLVLNGIDAMKDTGPAGILTITSEVKDGQLLVSVSDMGTGLPPDHADQIYNAFFTTKAHGTGMGLTISRSIIESHGGRLWATANSGPGTTFHFSLPIETRS